METYEIKIRIDDESQLYSAFDPDRNTLSADLLSYLAERYTEKEFKKKAVLVFSGCSIDSENLKEALRRRVELELNKVQRQKRYNFFKQLRLFLTGLAIIVLGYVLAKRLSAVPTEILSIVGSFAIWESANIWIVKNPDLRMQERLMERLLDADILIEQHNEKE